MKEVWMCEWKETGEHEKSDVFCDNEESDWPTVLVFVRCGFCSFDFLGMRSILDWSFYQQMTLDSSRGFSLSFEFSC